MFVIGPLYSEYYDLTDPLFPGGKGVPATTPDSTDGTPWRYLFFNDIIGGKQALYIAAFGSLDGISGEPDNAENSDLLKSVQALIQKAIKGQYYVKNIKGIETVIPLSELNIEYEPDKSFFIFTSPHGKYLEFLPFGAEILEDGLHIYAQRIIDGKIEAGTRLKRWGDGGKWGNGGKWGEFGSMPINIMIKEL